MRVIETEKTPGRGRTGIKRGQRFLCRAPKAPPAAILCDNVQCLGLSWSVVVPQVAVQEQILQILMLELRSKIKHTFCNEWCRSVKCNLIVQVL